MSNSLLKYSVVLLFALFLSWAYLFTPHLFSPLNTYISDLFFKTRGDLPQNQNVVIVDIDESSLEAFGQWPWSRSRVSDLINKISDAKAGIIGLDIVFAEADKTSPHTIASKLNIDEKNLENYDQILAKTFATTPTIGGYFFRFDKKKHDKIPMIPAVFFEKGLQNNYSIFEPKGVVLNIDILQENLYSSGFFNNIPDSDGMIRSVPLIMRYDGMIYSSLVFEMLRIYSKVNDVVIFGDEMGVEKIEFGDFSIPTDYAGRLYVNYRGGRGHFKYISAADILNGNFDVKDIAGKFVLIGTSAIALADLRAIPLDNVIPGVEIQANVLDNILQGDFLYEPFNILIYDLLIIWGIILIFSLLFSYLNFWLLLPVTVMSLFLLSQIFFHLFFDVGIVLNLLFPLLAFSGTFLLILIMDYLSTSRQKEFIQRTFEKKVSKAVMDDLIKVKGNVLMEAHERNVAIYFSDIRGFTTISENIGSSKKLVALLNRYTTPMVEEISKREGTIDKFIGDSIMAYWNAPNHVDNYVDKAVTTALKQLQVLNELNYDLNIEFGVTLKIGIGIHTGGVTVGEMGSIDRSDYTIIGDNVNLASRIEGLNKLYGTTLIISEDAKNALKDEYTIRSLDIVQVRGKHKSIEVFEVLSLGKDEKLSVELDHYSRALSLYRNRELKKAYKEFEILYDKYKTELYRIYRNRCKEHLDDPQRAFNIVYAR